MKTLMVEILTRDERLFMGKAESVTMRGLDGELQVLPGHVLYVNVLVPGEVRLHSEDKTCLHFKHAGGVVSVEKDRTVLLLDKLEAGGAVK